MTWITWSPGEGIYSIVSPSFVGPPACRRALTPIAECLRARVRAEVRVSSFSVG